MLTEIKTRRKARKHQKKILNLFTQYFEVNREDLLKQEETWKKWLTVEYREWRDLRDLLTSNVNNAYKARALTILFSPSIQKEWLPFAWTHEGIQTSSIVWLWFHEEKETLTLCDLDPQLFNFALTLIETNASTVLSFPWNEDWANTLGSYNRLIIQALEIIPNYSRGAERLFALYQINDPVPYWNMDFASGYEPFHLLLSSKIDEKWKRLADLKMRQIIEAERLQETAPRKNWEAAFPLYRSHVEMGVDNLPYSTALFAEQVDFILSEPNPGNKFWFSSWKISKILRLLEDKGEVQQRFMRHAVLTYFAQQEYFSVEDLEVAENIVSLIKESQLIQLMYTYIVQCRKSIASDQAAATQHTNEVNAVLEKMK